MFILWSIVRLCLVLCLDLSLYLLCLSKVLFCGNAGKRITKVSKFASSSGVENDPLLSKVTNMKHLGIINKILAIQASISPITKFVSAFLLSILALNCVISK